MPSLDGGQRISLSTMKKPSPIQSTRRDALRTTAVGFGNLALMSLLTRQDAGSARAELVKPYSPARAKRVIFLFMKGGPSHVDTFDPKPLLTRDDGGKFPFEEPRIKFAATGKLLKSPWKFKQYGESGLPVSELFPHVAQCVDDLCMIRSLHGTIRLTGVLC